MLFNFYYKTINPVSCILFYVLVGLLIAILIVNNRMNYTVDQNNEKKFRELLKAQKALIWTNFSIISLFFLYILIISFYFFTPRFQELYNRRKGILLRNILFFCLVILSTGLTYYINKSIDNMNLLNAKEELKKIYIIVPIVSIIAICLSLYNFVGTEHSLRYMYNYFTQYQLDDIESVTRNSTPTRLSSSLSEYLPNRFSPQLLEYEDDY
jgi:magnesium-transporting ATPase (P-type)